jgi:hypothetical protein
MSRQLHAFFARVKEESRHGQVLVAYDYHADIQHALQHKIKVIRSLLFWRGHRNSEVRDMPQPLSSINPEYTVQEWGAGALRKYPNLAALAMEVIGIWSYIDMKLGGILAHFMRADLETATIMHQAIVSMEARIGVLRAAAEHVMPKDDFELFAAAISTTRASQTARHDFAHHVWGICEKVPDALVLTAPKYMAAERARLLGALARGGNPKMGPHGFPWDGTKWFVYKEQDFRNAIADAQRAFDVVSKLSDFTFPLTPKDKCDSTRDELKKDPLVAQALEKRSRQN